MSRSSIRNITIIGLLVVSALIVISIISSASSRRSLVIKRIRVSEKIQSSAIKFISPNHVCVASTLSGYAIYDTEASAFIVDYDNFKSYAVLMHNNDFVYYAPPFMRSDRIVYSEIDVAFGEGGVVTGSSNEIMAIEKFGNDLRIYSLNSPKETAVASYQSEEQRHYRFYDFFDTASKVILVGESEDQRTTFYKTWDYIHDEVITQEVQHEHVASFAGGSTVVAIGFRNGNVYLSKDNGQNNTIINCHSNIVRGVAILEDKNIMVTCSPDQTIAIWDLGSLGLIDRYHYDTGIWGMDTNGSIVAAITGDSEIILMHFQ